MRYTFTTSNGSGLSTGSGISGNHSHHITTDLGYQVDAETRAILSAIGTLVEGSTTGGQSTDRRTELALLWHQYWCATCSVLYRKSLWISWPYGFQASGRKGKAQGKLAIKSGRPIPLSPYLTLTLTTNQSIVNTAGEVNNVGLVLRQEVVARLTYTPSAVWTAALLVNYRRNELLESSGTIGAEQGRTDNLVSAGLSASYALTSVVSLTGAYLYQRRDSNKAGNNFDENRVTIAVTGRFPVSPLRKGHSRF